MTFNDQSIWTLTQDPNVPVTQVANTGLQFAIGTGVGRSELKLYGRNLTSSRTQVKIRTPVMQEAQAPILRWERDAQNYLQITLWSGLVAVEVCVAGTLVQVASTGGAVTPTPTNLSIRARDGRVYYSYSTNGGSAYTLLYSGPAPMDLQYVFVKLIAGRSVAGGTPATLTLTDFYLGVHNVLFSDWAGEDTRWGKFATGGAPLPNISGGTLNCPVPVRTTTQTYSGANTQPQALDFRDGHLFTRMELSPGGVGLQAWLSVLAQMWGLTPDEGAQVNIAQFAFLNRVSLGGRRLHWYVADPVTGATLECVDLNGTAQGQAGGIPIGQDFVWVHIVFMGGRILFEYTLHPDGWYWQHIGTFTPHWPKSRVKMAGLVQLIATSDVDNPAGTVIFDQTQWEGRGGDQRWPLYGGEVSSLRAVTLLQTIKPTTVPATSSAGQPKVVAGIHLEPTGVPSTAVVSAGNVISQGGVLRPFGIPATSTVGSPRVPAYVRMTGRPSTATVGQPTLIAVAPILPPQPRVEIRWTLILCDQWGYPLEDISSFALDKQFGYRLNRPESLTFRVPSDHRLVNELAPDGRPNLAIIRRTIKAYRQERLPSGATTNVLRFVGWIWQLQDEGDADTAWTEVSCYGPMQRLARRICTNSSGSITAATWTATDGGLIVHSILSQLNAGAAWAHSGIDSGTREPTDVRTVDLTNMSLSAAIVQLTSAFNGFDVNFVPLDRRDGHLARLDIMSRRGTHRAHAILGWGIAPHNVLQASRLFDAETYANTITLQGATPEVDGARPIQAEAVDTAQQQDVGIYRVVDSYPDVSHQAYLQALATEELGFRKRAREIVSLQLQGGRAPEPFTEWNLGDTVPLYVGARQRGGYQGVVRVYGFDLDVDNEGKEIVSSLILSPEGA